MHFVIVTNTTGSCNSMVALKILAIDAEEGVCMPRSNGVEAEGITSVGILDATLLNLEWQTIALA